MKTIVHAALDRLAETYKPDAKDCDKCYNPNDRPVKQNPEDDDPVYGTYYVTIEVVAK